MNIDVDQRNLPNFFIIGAAKSGTTSLAYYLNQHPEIYIPKEKETNFFDDDRMFNKGVSFYAKHFYSRAGKYLARGDATPAYMRLFEKTIPRIQCCIPKQGQRFIVILRDPAVRAWSHYQHMSRTRLERLPFKDALAAEERRLADNPDRWVGYFRDGLYAKQLSRWFAAFKRENFFVILHHRFISEPNQILKEAFHFLGVDSTFRVPDLSWKNEAGIPRIDLLMRLLSEPSLFSRMYAKLVPLQTRLRLRTYLINLNTKRGQVAESPDPQVMAELKARYKKDIQELERMLGWDLHQWYDV